MAQITKALDLADRPHKDTDSRSAALPWARTDFLALATIAVTALGLVWRLWTPGIQNRVDMLIGIYRIFELVTAWRDGIWYARLGPDLNFSYGAPLFQFYPPLASYVGLLFYGFGIGYIGAAKATFAAALLLAGAGMYLFARSLVPDRSAAWLSAMMYLAAPYLLLDVYERGAAAEALALGLLPWLFWALRRLLKRHDPVSFFLAGALVAAVMLAHNITMLFVLPAALGYIVLLTFFEQRRAELLWVFGATCFGLALSSFYWAPAVVEIQATHAEEFMLGAGKTVAGGLLGWRELFQKSFVSVYQGPLRFRFALRPLIFAALALVALPLFKRRLRFELGVLALMWLAVMYLQTESALWFWQNIPLVRFIQFTWRLYGLASLAIALLIGGALTVLPLRAGYRWGVAGVLVGVALWSSAAQLSPAHLPGWYEIDEAEIGRPDLFARGQDGFPLFSDYQPLAMNTSSLMMTMPLPPESRRFPPVVPAPKLQVAAENFTHIQLQVDAPAPFTLRAQRIFFPGWQVYADGRPVATTATGKLGLVTAAMPAGSYTASIQFDQTPVRWLSDLISLLCLAALVAAVAAGRHWRRRWHRGIVAAVLVIAASLYLQGPGKIMRTPVVASANFQDVLHLLGYSSAKTSWRAGEDLQLRLYWYVQQAPLADYKVFVHVSELDDTGKVTQMDTMPMFNFSPTTRWEAGELKIDQLVVPLPPAIKPGRYRVVIGLYPVDQVQNLSVLSGDHVLPGDRVGLMEVVITAAEPGSD